MTRKLYKVYMPWKEEEYDKNVSSEKPYFDGTANSGYKYDGATHDDYVVTGPAAQMLKEEILDLIDELYKSSPQEIVVDDVIVLKELLSDFIAEAISNKLYMLNTKLYRIIASYDYSELSNPRNKAVEIAADVVARFLKNSYKFSCFVEGRDGDYRFKPTILSVSGRFDFDIGEEPWWDEDWARWRVRDPSLSELSKISKSKVISMFGKEYDFYPSDSDDEYVEWLNFDYRPIDYQKMNSGSGFWKYRHIKGKAEASATVRVRVDKYLQDNINAIMSGVSDALKQYLYEEIDRLERYASLAKRRPRMLGIYRKELLKIRSAIEYL